MKNIIIKEDISGILASGLDWGRFRNKTVLISGANGFLPAYMVETLLTLNEVYKNQHTKVIALVRNLLKAKDRFQDYLRDENLIFLNQDVCFSIENIRLKVDYIIHAASQASPKYYGVDPVGTLLPNVIGTRNLLDLAKQHDVEAFLFFSSSEVYGVIEDNLVPTKEAWFGPVDPTQLRSCYSESKRMGENMCISWFNQFGIKAKIVRPFHTYGPKMQLNDGRVFADFVADVVNNRDIIMKSDGSAKRAFCYLSDATLGFFTVLLNGECGEAYNVGNPDCEYSVLELAKIIIGLFPQKKLRVIEKELRTDLYLKSQVIRNVPSIDKVKKIGWRPIIDVRDGFTRTIRSYL